MGNLAERVIPPQQVCQGREDYHRRTAPECKPQEAQTKTAVTTKKVGQPSPVRTLGEISRSDTVQPFRCRCGSSLIREEAVKRGFAFEIPHQRIREVGRPVRRIAPYDTLYSTRLGDISKASQTHPHLEIVHVQQSTAIMAGFLLGGSSHPHAPSGEPLSC